MSTVRIQVRRGTAAQWASINPILAAGEMGLESDTNFIKFGDGTAVWTSLPYANEPLANIQNALADYVAVADLGQPNGVATLNSSGKVPASQMDVVELAQDAVDSALTAGTGILKTYDDAANTLTVAVDTSVIATKAELAESAQDAINSALVAGRGISKSYNDAGNEITVAALVVGGNNIVNTNDPNSNNIVISLNDNPSISGTVSAGELSAPIINASNTLNAANVQITGNLTVGGTTTSVNTTNFTTADPLIYLGDGNTSNVLDLGFVTAFNDGTYQHAGLVRDASDGKWKLFSGVTTEPGTTVDFTTYNKDTLEVGVLNSTSAKIGNVINTEIQYLSGVTSGIQSQIDAKSAKTYVDDTFAPKNNPTFTGTVTLPNLSITESELGAGIVSSSKIAAATIDNSHISTTAGIAKTKIAGTAVTQADTATVTDAMLAGSIQKSKVTGLETSLSDLQSAVNAKAPIDGATLTGTVTLPATTSIGTVSSIEIGYVDGVTSSIQTQLNTGASNLSSHSSATTNVHGISDTAALATKAGTETLTNKTIDLTSNTLSGTKAQFNAAMSDADFATIAGTETLTNKTLTSPSITTPTGIVKADVGLGNVDNTSDASKPVSTATQTALDLKANLANPTFTGTVTAENATITGNLTVTGTTTTVNATNLAVSDPLIYMGTGNSANASDLGLVGHFNNGTYQHTGLVRDHADGKWKLFSGVTTEPGSATIDLTGATYDALKIGALEGTTASHTTISASGLITASSGVAFSDGTQTKVAVPSITTINQQTGTAYTVAASDRDSLVEVSNTGAITVTIPTNATTAFPVGTSIDILQTNTGQITIAGAAGVTVNGTPGLKLRTQWSSATLFKRATDTWVVMGDLSA